MKILVDNITKFKDLDIFRHRIYDKLSRIYAEAIIDNFWIDVQMFVKYKLSEPSSNDK